MAAQPALSGTESSERCCVYSLPKAVKMIQNEGLDLLTLHCWMTVTLASLWMRKPKNASNSEP